MCPRASPALPQCQGQLTLSSAGPSFQTTEMEALAFALVLWPLIPVSIHPFCLSCGLREDGCSRDLSRLAQARPSSSLGTGPLEPARARSGGTWSPGVGSSHAFDPQDIVTESNKFDLVSFIPLLRERIYSNNQYARQFIISWVSLAPRHSFSSPNGPLAE